ncbi:cytochrome P450 6CK3 isoform X1 [Nasonia vitripennis]|uniref:Cytochrome P450 n=1 Tax=Nasonia vitripennis TaxID=7425 RepID=A0A7M7IR49_NASVI|nr:cytochrome P450 6CK3 [Nasonia vitripennis]XP_016838728.1 cytochrome P450 6CK3 isoform X1 [Nasonia vitripennis]
MELLLLFALLLFVLYFYLKYVVYDVWRRAGIPHDRPSIPLGTLPLDYIRRKATLGSILTNSYKRYKRFPLHGVYVIYKPVLVITDPKIIQLVLVKDCNIFLDRGFYADPEKDLISLSLARVNGERWRILRRQLSSSFAPKKIKFMFLMVKEFCERLIEIYEDELRESDVVRIDELTSRFTIDCAFATLFGFNCNLLKNPDNDFYKYGKQSNEQGVIYSIISFFLPELAALCRIPKVRRDTNSFFERFFENMIDCQKKKNMAENNLLGAMMQLMKGGSNRELDENTKLTTQEAAAQLVTFFAPSQGMPAFVIIHCLYELSLNPEVQERLYKEIYETACRSEELTYRTLSELSYLNLVLQETLRKHTPLPVLNRIAIEDFSIPDSDIVIRKNTRIAISTHGLHHDPDIYPDPEKFDPTRFTPENKAKRHSSTYLPFGTGPRFCIGKQQGILIPKLALFYLLLNYKFSVCDNTPANLEYLPEHLILILKNEIYLRIEKRKELDHVHQPDFR